MSNLTESCDVCKGEGFILNVSTGKAEMCRCTLQQRVNDYLTDTYRNAVYVPTLKVDAIRGRNVLFEDDSIDTFKSAVKSYLLNTGMVYEHVTISPQDCVQAFLAMPEQPEWDIYKRKNILVLVFSYDPNNSQYSNIITSVLDARKMVGLPTWVYSRWGTKTNMFITKYGMDLSDYLNDEKNGFVRVGN